jgi:hypothetical protein
MSSPNISKEWRHLYTTSANDCHLHKHLQKITLILTKHLQRINEAKPSIDALSWRSNYWNHKEYMVNLQYIRNYVSLVYSPTHGNTKYRLTEAAHKRKAAISFPWSPVISTKGTFIWWEVWSPQRPFQLASPTDTKASPFSPLTRSGYHSNFNGQESSAISCHSRYEFI